MTLGKETDESRQQWAADMDTDVSSNDMSINQIAHLHASGSIRCVLLPDRRIGRK